MVECILINGHVIKALAGFISVSFSTDMVNMHSHTHTL